eukprot:5832083-Pleurochrysis_carterae.AAC.1
MSRNSETSTNPPHRGHYLHRTQSVRDLQLRTRASERGREASRRARLRTRVQRLHVTFIDKSGNFDIDRY